MGGLLYEGFVGFAWGFATLSEGFVGGFASASCYLGCQGGPFDVVVAALSIPKFLDGAGGE
jgi:hypothetical protein